MHSSFWGHRCIHVAAHSSKIFKPLSAIILSCQSYSWTGKTQIRNSNVLWCLQSDQRDIARIWNCNLLLVSMNVSEIYFFIKFWIFLLLYLVCGCMTFDLQHMAKWWLKAVCTDEIKSSFMYAHEYCISKCIPKCWRRSVKRNSNLNFIRVINNSSFDQHILYIWSKPF